MRDKFEFIVGSLLLIFMSYLLYLVISFGITITSEVTANSIATVPNSHKSDGECTGQETAGRCADKCPEGTYLLGYKDDTRAAICKLNATGCPYGDTIPLDQCDKFAEQQPKPQQFVGK